MENLIRFLQQTHLIGDAKAREIANHFSRRILDKNEFLLKEDRVANEYLFLEKGFMRSFALNTDGNEVTTGFFGANQVVFEVSSFFHRVPSRENIQSITECEGWSVTFEGLNGLFHAMPEFREFGRHVLVTCFAALKVRMLSMITETAEERYGHLLASNPEIIRYAPLKYIASYLGVTDTSLSRIRKEFAKNHPTT